jgi:hypothetical protein
MLAALVKGRTPSVLIPAHPEPGQIQIRIYDRWAPAKGPETPPPPELTRSAPPQQVDSPPTRY